MQPHDTPFDKKYGLLMFPGFNSALRNRIWAIDNVQRLPLSLSLDSHRSFVINASALLSNWTRRGYVQAGNSVVTKDHHLSLMLRLECQRNTLSRDAGPEQVFEKYIFINQSVILTIGKPESNKPKSKHKAIGGLETEKGTDRHVHGGTPHTPHVPTTPEWYLLYSREVRTGIGGTKSRVSVLHYPTRHALTPLTISF
jgi:hypothetical protein